jgi:hypothetical protein
MDNDGNDDGPIQKRGMTMMTTMDDDDNLG